MNQRKLAFRLGAFALLSSGAVTGLALSATDSRSQAMAVLAQLAKQPLAGRVAEEPMAKAQNALRRAEQLRASGDQKRGALLEQTALEWALTSELLEKTAQAERRLAELQAHTTELETKVFRAQALVEQTVARRARAEEALRKLDEKGAKP